jgi:2-polyprenyl-3-methyl-5-hydroxy-6-metoxy-1,4-benzoquinol methylase
MARRFMAAIVVALITMTDGFNVRWSPKCTALMAISRLSWPKTVQQRQARAPSRVVAVHSHQGVSHGAFTHVFVSDSLSLPVYELSGDECTFIGADDGGKIWPCSVEMARFLAQQLCEFAGQRVLEVGAGTGLCSLVISSASSTSVIASDINPRNLELIRSSAQEGHLDLKVLEYDICDVSQPLPPCDWLVASDVLYSADIARSLADRCDVSTLLRLCSRVLTTIAAPLSVITAPW